MIDSQGILQQVRRGDLLDNWRVFRYSGFSCGLVLKIWWAIYTPGIVLVILLGTLPLRGPLLLTFLPLYLIPIFLGLPFACLSTWQLGVALLVIVPDGVIHVVDDRYLQSRCSILTSEGRRRRADYRSKVMYNLSEHVFGWYPYTILSFADIASMQLKVSYVRGSWLELYYHNGERKRWLVEPYLDAVAIESTQSVIVAHTRYVTELSQIIAKE